MTPRRALALAALIAAAAACSHEGAAPWTPAADPPGVSDSTLSVLFSSAGTLVWERLDPVSGESRRLVTARGGDPQASDIVWSPDGRLAALQVSTSSDDLALIEVDLASSATRELPPRADAGHLSTLFFRDGVLFGWSDATPPGTFRLDARGWRPATAQPPDDVVLTRWSDFYLHYSTRDADAGNNTYDPRGPIAIPTLAAPLRHRRGRFVLVSSDDEPYERLEDDHGRTLWKTPPSGWAVWWPAPLAAPPVTTTPTPRYGGVRKYYLEPDRE